jgi:hypothetical protein
MLESKTINCDPKDEAEILDTYQTFLWKMVNRQVIFNKEEKFDGASSFTSQYGNTGGTVYTHEEITNYVSLLLQRDTANPLYEQIASIQQKWEIADRNIDNIYYVVNTRRNKKGQKLKSNTPMVLIGALSSIVGIIFISIGGNGGNPIHLSLIAIGVILMVMALILIIATIVKASAAGKVQTEPNATEKQQIVEYQNEKVDCIDKAKKVIIEREKSAK